MKNPCIALIALSALACEAVPSAALDTGEITAEYHLTAEADGLVQVEARLKLAGTALTFVDLAASDQLVVDDGQRARPIDGVTSVFDAITYQTRAPVRPGPVQVRLMRRDWPSATESWVVLPRPFSVRTAHRDYIFALDDVPLLWSDASPHDVRVEIDGPCVRDARWVVPDEGFFVITPDMLAARRSWDGDRCVVDVRVERLYEGDLDPRLAGGRITASQARHTRFDLYR